jgi:hypothetical protein
VPPWQQYQLVLQLMLARRRSCKHSSQVKQPELLCAVKEDQLPQLAKQPVRLLLLMVARHIYLL